MDEVTGDSLQGFVVERIHEEMMVFTNDATAYKSLPKYDSVKHSGGE